MGQHLENVEAHLNVGFVMLPRCACSKVTSSAMIKPCFIIPTPSARRVAGECALSGAGFLAATGHHIDQLAHPRQLVEGTARLHADAVE